MPYIICIYCGSSIDIDDDVIPYMAQLACPECMCTMRVNINPKGEETTLNPAILVYDDLSKKRKIWSKLSKMEKKSIKEASYAFGIEAFTASELMSLRTIESVLRRIYKVDETFGKLIRRMEKDERLSDLQGIVSYFKDERNKVAHPDRLSSELEAKSTFEMTKRLLIQIIERIPKF